MKSQNLQITNVSKALPSNSFNYRDAERIKHIQKPMQEEIQGWVVLYLTELLSIEESEIDITLPFSYYGLDSVAAIGLISELQNCLKFKLDPTLVYDYPTTEALVDYLYLYSQEQS